MKTIQTAVVQYLQCKTGIRAATDKSKAAGYPALVVEIAQSGCVLLDGGRQREQSYTLTVRAASDRERDGKTALLTDLSAALCAGIPYTEAGGGMRVLHPLDIKTQGDTLTFTVTVCQMAPEAGTGGAEVMETINLNL